MEVIELIDKVRNGKDSIEDWLIELQLIDSGKREFELQESGGKDHYLLRLVSHAPDEERVMGFLEQARIMLASKKLYSNRSELAHSGQFSQTLPYN